QDVKATLERTFKSEMGWASNAGPTATTYKSAPDALPTVGVPENASAATDIRTRALAVVRVNSDLTNRGVGDGFVGWVDWLCGFPVATRKAIPTPTRSSR
ncbi:MAG: hypothetical protein ACKODX_12400, partial [Gemmata sp.]